MEISRVLYSDERRNHDVNYIPNIVFAHRETGDLALQLLSPAFPNFPRPKRRENYGDKDIPHWEPPEDTRVFPLVVTVPGSGWGGAEGFVHVPKMVELAKQGFVVASIAYRGTFKDNVRFPAAVQDTKEAIRFLRANAGIYHVDTEHVSLLGDSSGGHTVAMAALTGDEERFSIGENLDQTAKVNACVIFYGPNDLLNLVQDRINEGKRLRPDEGEFPFEAHEIFQEDYRADPKAMLADASPINYIKSGEKMPAFLFLNGEEDPIIPLAQGIRFCKRVKECGGRAEFVKIAAAGHGNGCWSPEAMELVAQFLKAYN